MRNDMIIHRVDGDYGERYKPEGTNLLEILKIMSLLRKPFIHSTVVPIAIERASINSITEIAEYTDVFRLVDGMADIEETWFKNDRVNFILDNFITNKICSDDRRIPCGKRSFRGIRPIIA